MTPFPVTMKDTAKNMFANTLEGLIDQPATRLNKLQTSSSGLARRLPRSLCFWNGARTKMWKRPLPGRPDFGLTRSVGDKTHAHQLAFGGTSSGSM